MHFLAYSRRFRNFDDQIVRVENITHVIYIIIILKIHVKRLFLYVISFNQYFIIMSFFWFRCHEIHVNFEFNIFIMFSFFCLFHCCSIFVKVQKIIRKTKILIFQKFQRIWKFKNKKKLFNFNFSILFVYEKTFRSIVQKKHFNTFRSVVRKKHFNISRLIVRKKHFNTSRLIVRKKHFSISRSIVQKKTF